MLWLAAAALIVGLALLLVGLRGRRTDDHPICRKCRFDLIGLTPPQPNRDREGADTPAPHRCPECGSDLADPRAVRYGMRKKSPAAVSIGAALTLLGASAGTLVPWAAATNFNWSRLKPDWLIAKDLTGPRGTTDWSELTLALERLSAGTFGKSAAARVVDFAIAAQRGPSSAWDPSLGDLVEVAHAGKLTTPAQWGVYTRQLLPRIASVTPVISVAPNVTVDGRGLSALQVTSGTANSGTARTGLKLLCELRSMAVEGREVPAEALLKVRKLWVPYTPSWSFTAGITWPAAPPALPPSETRWVIRVLNSDGTVAAETEQTVPTTGDPEASPQEQQPPP